MDQITRVNPKFDYLRETKCFAQKLFKILYPNGEKIRNAPETRPKMFNISVNALRIHARVTERSRNITTYKRRASGRKNKNRFHFRIIRGDFNVDVIVIGIKVKNKKNSTQRVGTAKTRRRREKIDDLFFSPPSGTIRSNFFSLFYSVYKKFADTAGRSSKTLKRTAFGTLQVRTTYVFTTSSRVRFLEVLHTRTHRRRRRREAITRARSIRDLLAKITRRVCFFLLRSIR